MRRKRPHHPAPRPKARSAEILGDARMTFQPPPKWRKYNNRLVDLRNYLLNRRKGLSRDAAEEVPIFSMHMADAGTDEFDRDFALSMISSEQDALYEIDEALIRIRDGTYGICELTGKKIEAKRLEAIPWTRFSAAAERQLEKEGGVSRAHLGRREEVPKERAVQSEEETED